MDFTTEDDMQQYSKSEKIIIILLTPCMSSNVYTALQLNSQLKIS